MPVTVNAISNSDGPTSEHLVRLLNNSKAAFFAVAYGTYGGLHALDDGLGPFLRGMGRLQVLVDIDRHFTDPDLIDDLCTTPGDVQCRLFAPRLRGSITESHSRAFHPKVFYFERNNRCAAIVGSSNLTLGGLRNNHECSAIIEGSKQDRPFPDIRRQLEHFWSSPDVIVADEFKPFREHYERAYRAAKKRQRRPGVPDEAPLHLHDEDLESLREALVASKESMVSDATAYISGLIAGGFDDCDVRSRLLVISFRRGTINPGKRHVGKIFFPGVSERNLPQMDCVQRDADRIVGRLNNSFRQAGTADHAVLARSGDLSYRITLRFAPDSPIWAGIRSLRIRSKYAWPGSLDLKIADKRRAFLQGYMDLRTRISAADALPPPTPYMRVAISIGGEAPRFAQNFRQLLADEFACDEDRINLLQGRDRNRESMIRIDPSVIPRDFLLSPWQRLLVEDFRGFNAKLKV